MLPSNAISETANEAAFLEPDDVDFGLLESFELGGVAINDGTQGRQVQVWRAWVDGDSIKCSPISGTPVTTLVSGTGLLSSVSIAFDSNMQPVICYIEDGSLKLRWFNVGTGLFQTDTFADATSAKVATDDKRPSQVAISDVIFAYTRDGSLWWRTQRESYTVEREVGDSGTLILLRMGMNAANCFQFQLAEEGATP